MKIEKGLKTMTLLFKAWTLVHLCVKHSDGFTDSFISLTHHTFELPRWALLVENPSADAGDIRDRFDP